MAINLCKCLNCDTVMYDENPSEESYDFAEEDLIRMDIAEMVKVSDDDNGDFDLGWHIACPKCRTDAYLVDIVSIDQCELLEES